MASTAMQSREPLPGPSGAPGAGTLQRLESLPGVALLRAISRNPVGFVGFLGVVAFLLLAFVGPQVIPLDKTVRVDQIYQAPSLAHPMGTDYQGRDVWSQVVHGGRDILSVATVAALLTTIIAISLGALSALAGGWLDSLVVGLADVILTTPQLAILIVLAGLVRLNNVLLLAVILALLNWPSLFRAVRAQVLSLKERDYVEAARALDLGTRHIIFREIVPQIMSFIAIAFVFGMRGAIYGQVGLIFLGLVPLSGTNWGIMINFAWQKGAIFYKGSFWYIMGPVLMIALLQLSLVTMSRSLDEVFNPRLRTRI